MKNKKVVAIIQARVGSTRLPKKVLKLLKGETVISHVVQRVRQCKCIDGIVIATSLLDKDLEIVEEAKNIGVSYFRGSEQDVLNRYYEASELINADIIVRITSDCPLIDPIVVDEIVKFYINNNYNIVTNAPADLTKRTYPRGLDTEIFSFEVLKIANLYASKKYQREHVTPYIYENTDKIYYYINKKDYSKYRWTLDTEEDFILISKIYDYFYKGEHNFYLDEIVKYMENNPDLYKINKCIAQKEINKEEK
ncbi:glycosyltransferase family protein [Romboutsia lituseburensis]|uniref:glycosyltransferase family protein n=1 Tax=Romboutsia lituseburensis TaxID=1537 RepID=UPI00215AADF5|nr:glycosyltransferase family protein [Romboutsia lituseburensis]MCR8744768.1 glycosyltransferase family protein [Romboutsia lituseburensis]